MSDIDNNNDEMYDMSLGIRWVYNWVWKCWISY